jgi:anthranilate synthase component I
MRHHPPFDEFVRLAGQGNLVPVYRQLTGDTLTPVSAFCKIQEGDWAFLFESVVGGERLGRYSFLGSGPFLRFQAFGNRVQLQQGDKVVELEHPDLLLPSPDAECRNLFGARPCASTAHTARLV